MTFPQAVAIAASDGIVLRGLRWAGDADLVLLLHDARDNADLEDWNALVPFLLSQDVTVLAVDLRGHGASEGDWKPEHAPSDVSAMVGFARNEGAGCIVVVADGVSGIAALKAAEASPVDGIALLSTKLEEDAPVPRGAGVAKLLISGVADPAYKSALNRFRAASIGWALAVNLPTNQQGVALFDGPWAAQTREHIIAFLRERRGLSGGERTGAGRLPETYLDQIGLRATGGQP